MHAGMGTTSSVGPETTSSLLKQYRGVPIGKKNTLREEDYYDKQPYSRPPFMSFFLLEQQ